MIVTMSTYLEGYKVIKQLGIVRWIIVRSRSILEIPPAIYKHFWAAT